MLPTLVMECLPMTLAQCLDQYGVLPNEIGYSIVKDVALALSYLHQHNPPIIHRDLSANNVLLTRGMTAKISDLGVAKMLDLSPMQMSTMTNGPGTLCYMPPEALEEHAHYNCKVDAFSYGALMVHLFSGQWPFPTKAVKVDPQDDSRMIPQSEADRRQEKLDAIGRDHPLMTLILHCLHNSPSQRPEATEILKQVNQVVARVSCSSENIIELLQHVTSLRTETERIQQLNRSLKGDAEELQDANKTLRADVESLQHANISERADMEKLQESNRLLKADIERLQQEHQEKITSLRESSSAELQSTRDTLLANIKSAQKLQKIAEKSVEDIQRKMEDTECCHSVEVEQLNLRLADTRDTLSSRVGELETELNAAQQQISVKNRALSDRDEEVTKVTRQVADLRKEMVDQLTENKKAFGKSLFAKERLLTEEFNQKLNTMEKTLKEKLFTKDHQLVKKQKEFDKTLLAKDQMLIEKQKEFDQKLFEKQKELDQQLLEKQKELDQHLVERQNEFDQRILEMQKEFESQLLAKETTFTHTLISKDKQLAEKDEKQRELDQSLLAKDQLLLEKDQLLLEKDRQLQKLREKEAEFGALLQSKEAVLSSKESLVGSKDKIIHDLQKQMDNLRKSHTTKVIEARRKEMRSLEEMLSLQVNTIGALNEQVNYLNATYLPKALNSFPKGTKLKWQKCEDIPIGMAGAQAVVIRGTVYVGGGGAAEGTDEYVIQSYNPTNDKWSTLPPAPVHWFGIGELNGQLVIVGGKTRQGVVQGNVHTLDNSAHKWKQSLLPMPTARHSPAVFSQPSCLTVVGGKDQHDKNLCTVEIFLPQMFQWHKALHVPTPLYNMTTTVIDNRCFLTEYNSTEVYHLCVSVHQEESGPPVAPHVITKWKALPRLLYDRCALGSLGGCLLAVGGEEKRSLATTVQCYTPLTKTWKKVVVDLPEQRCYCTTVTLPTGELLVVGGLDGSFTNKVWKATML